MGQTMVHHSIAIVSGHAMKRQGRTLPRTGYDTLRFSVLELARVTGNLSRALWRSIMSTDEPGTASSGWFGGATHDAQGAASVALDSPQKRRSGGYRDRRTGSASRGLWRAVIAAMEARRSHSPAACTICLTRFDHIFTLHRMSSRLRKITVNVPADTLEAAIRVTGKGITSTIVEGLHELERRAKRSALRALRGKVRFELDLGETRR